MKEKVFIEINYNTYNLVIYFTLQFIIINLINILFGYYGIIPLMNHKSSETFKNIFKLMKLNNPNFKTNSNSEINNSKNNNKKYLTYTLIFFSIILSVLLFLNIYLLFKNSSKYYHSLKSQITFYVLIKILLFTIFILIIQVIYFNNFTYSYYISLGLKYIL